MSYLVLASREAKFSVSRTVKAPISASSCSTKHVISRQSASVGVTPLTSTGDATFWAPVGRDASTVSSVVLPQPEGPMRAQISPGLPVSLYTENPPCPRDPASGGGARGGQKREIRAKTHTGLDDAFNIVHDLLGLLRVAVLDRDCHAAPRDGPDRRVLEVRLGHGVGFDELRRRGLLAGRAGRRPVDVGDRVVTARHLFSFSTSLVMGWGRSWVRESFRRTGIGG